MEEFCLTPGNFLLSSFCLRGVMESLTTADNAPKETISVASIVYWAPPIAPCESVIR
jgi:hypothetical protein